MKTIMSWKGCVGKGWHPIVEDAIKQIEARGGFIRQIKEKFAGLRIYVHGGDYDAIDDIVRTAEHRASLTCEDCGAPGTVKSVGFWDKTLCPNCHSKHKV
jgi:hypothetical protein